MESGFRRTEQEEWRHRYLGASISSQLLEELPVPAIAPDEVLCYRSAVNVLDRDIKKISLSHEPPRIFGHETAGN